MYAVSLSQPGPPCPVSPGRRVEMTKAHPANDGPRAGPGQRPYRETWRAGAGGPRAEAGHAPTDMPAGLPSPSRP
jgi:hypothetical protein